MSSLDHTQKQLMHIFFLCCTGNGLSFEILSKDYIGVPLAELSYALTLCTTVYYLHCTTNQRDHQARLAKKLSA